MGLFGTGRALLGGARREVIPWYRGLTGSVPIANVQAAYTPYGAASLAASYDNNAAPANGLPDGTYDCTPGNVPTFDALSGWVMNGNYLKTGCIPAQNWTMLVHFRHVTSGGLAAGCLGAGTSRFWVWPANSTMSDYGHGASLTIVAGARSIGVMTVAGPTGYLNGVSAGAIDAGNYNFVECYLGCINDGGSPGWYLVGDISHAALYNISLTNTQQLDVFNAIPNIYRYFVAFGDSTCSSSASDAAHRWPNIVAAAQGWTLTNSGADGTVLQNTVQNTVATIGAAANNNGRDTYDNRILDYAPDTVAILYGLNDLRLNDVAFSAAEFETDLTAVINAVIATGTHADHIYVGSPPYIPAASYAAYAPWDGGSAVKHAQYVAACAAAAAATGATYIDVYQWMIDNGGDALIAVDGIHPNDAGHAAIAAAFLSVM